MVTDVLSRFILDASQLPTALPQDVPWRIAGRVDDLVLELLGSLPSRLLGPSERAGDLVCWLPGWSRRGSAPRGLGR